MPEITLKLRAIRRLTPVAGREQNRDRMKTADFDFDLPEWLIATRPARPRSSARLLVAQGDRIADAVVRELS